MYVSYLYRRRLEVATMHMLDGFFVLNLSHTVLHTAQSLDKFSYHVSRRQNTAVRHVLPVDPSRTKHDSAVLCHVDTISDNVLHHGEQAPPIFQQDGTYKRA